MEGETDTLKSFLSSLPCWGAALFLVLEQGRAVFGSSWLQSDLEEETPTSPSYASICRLSILRTLRTLRIEFWRSRLGAFLWFPHCRHHVADVLLNFSV